MIEPPGHAIHLAQHNSQVGNLRHVQYAQRTRTLANDAVAFRLLSHHESGLVTEINQRQVKHVADLQETTGLVRRRHVQRAAHKAAIVGHDPDRIAVHPRKPRDPGAAVQRLDLKERITIEHDIEQLADIVGLARVARNE